MQLQGPAGGGVRPHSGLAGPGGSAQWGFFPSVSERMGWGTTLCLTAAVNADL